MISTYLESTLSHLCTIIVLIKHTIVQKGVLRVFLAMTLIKSILFVLDQPLYLTLPLITLNQIVIVLLPIKLVFVRSFVILSVTSAETKWIAVSLVQILE